jgi:hypothetical protein
LKHWRSDDVLVSCNTPTQSAHVDGWPEAAGCLYRDVGPQTATGENVTKRDVKRVLAPLKSFWSKPEENEPRTQPDVPVMSYREFRNNARILLTEAGLLEQAARDE